MQVVGKCGQVSTRICGMAGGTCVRSVDQVPCSARIDSKRVVINGVCNGSGGCSVTDQQQVGETCCGSCDTTFHMTIAQLIHRFMP